MWSTTGAAGEDRDQRRGRPGNGSIFGIDPLAAATTGDTPPDIRRLRREIHRRQQGSRDTD